nr:MAG TPA: hypothetical protein [Caudoviricetes sp.]
MANLKEIDIYKQKIIEMLLSDDIIVQLLTSDPNRTTPAKDLVYTQVFPYDWMDLISLTAQAYICVDVDILKLSSNYAVKDCTMTVWVMCHQQAMSLRGSDNYGLSYVGGTLRDKLADRIDYLINGHGDFGFGKVNLLKAPRFDPGGQYYGRELVYYVQDFNRSPQKL